MITADARRRTVAALRRLRADGGGYPDSPGGIPDLGATLSALKALAFLGADPEDPDGTAAFVLDHFDRSTGTCANPATGAPAVLATAGGLINLHVLGAYEALGELLPRGLAWMAANASTREEHFMTVAVVEECGGSVSLERSVEYFRSIEGDEGAFGPGALMTGIASSALLRAGQQLKNPKRVSEELLEAQTASGGFADDGGDPDLWTTYCVMRALDLLRAVPAASLASWIGTLALDGGGFGAGGALSVNATYQCLSVLDWIAGPVIEGARRGDLEVITRHLSAGGDPDLSDLQGWTPLAAAAVTGQSAVVRTLLEHGADQDRRLEDADALPVFWAGQSGDVESVAALLERRPEHLFATSSVNGHTVLLQAAFFGTERHRNLAEWLLANVGTVLGLGAPAALEVARQRLLAACNVRGYTATTMARLWGNEEMAALFAGADHTTDEERDAYRRDLLAAIARPLPDAPDERRAQQQTDELVAAITEGFERLNAAADRPAELGPMVEQLLASVRSAVEADGFEINRLGGPLSETPVIVAVTGVDASAQVAEARRRLTVLLLEHGADPDLPELHPMGVDAVIRSAVLNHFACLQEISRFMGPLAFAAALNTRPAINGQTALDDTVHRALTAGDDSLQSHLDQIRWAVAHGGRTDIPDFTGVTVADRARLALEDAIFGRRAPVVLEALGLAAPAAGPSSQAT